MRYPLGLVLLLLCACSPVPSASPGAGSQPAAAPARPQPPVLVVARLDPSGNGGPVQVSLVDGTGKAIAGARFVQPREPELGNAAAIRQDPVQVAAGAAFFADAQGVVRRLGRDGKVSVITTFPVHGLQDELSFAVSPDGSRLLASILSTPPLHVPPPRTIEDPVFADQGHWSLQMLTATPGAAPTSTFRQDLGTAYPNPTVVVGWDENGPLAAVSTDVGAQNRPVITRFVGTAVVHIAPDGSHLGQVGGRDCAVQDELLDGTVLCKVGIASSAIYVVRRSTGELLWRADLHGRILSEPHLSPDGQRVADQDLVFGAGTQPVRACQAASPASYCTVQGWLDRSNMVVAVSAGRSGTTPEVSLNLVNAAGPGQPHDLGVSAEFVGVI